MDHIRDKRSKLTVQAIGKSVDQVTGPREEQPWANHQQAEVTIPGSATSLMSTYQRRAPNDRVSLIDSADEGVSKVFD